MKELLQGYWDHILLIWPKLIMAAIVFLVFYFIGRGIRGVVAKKIKARWGNTIVSGFVIQVSSWIAYIIGLFVALNVMGFNNLFSGLLAGAGFSAVVIGFAFKDIAENFLAGILLAFNRPFEIGNIIEVESYQGTVKRLNLRNTHLRNAEGKDIFIPNSIIIKNTLINYTLDGLHRLDFAVGIAPESDIHKCRKLVMAYLNASEFVLKEPKPNILVQELGTCTVDFKVFFWVDVMAFSAVPDKNLGQSTRSKVIADIKDLLDSNGIEMPATVLEHKMYGENSISVSQKS